MYYAHYNAFNNYWLGVTQIMQIMIILFSLQDWKIKKYSNTAHPPVCILMIVVHFLNLTEILKTVLVYFYYLRFTEKGSYSEHNQMKGFKVLYSKQFLLQINFSVVLD